MTTKIKKATKNICVIDVETDPFEVGQVPLPFLWGVFDGVDYRTFFAKEQMFEHLKAIGAKVVWAHNGGKFDFWYLANDFDEWSKPMIVSGRLMEIEARGIKFRDSYSLIPTPLSAWHKEKIDYSKFTRRARWHHLSEIIDYLEIDCRALHAMLTAFRTRFGDGLHTIAQASRRQAGTILRANGLRFPKASYSSDILCRPAYHGGRCEVFVRGSFTFPLALYDIVSAYPWAMTFSHPCGKTFKEKLRTTPVRFENTSIYEIRADSNGALPQEIFNPEHRLIFPDGIRNGWFQVFGHEINSGLETDTLSVREVRSQIVAEDQIDFRPFVAKFFDEKTKSRELEKRLFSKLILNALSGKLGVNPSRYQSHILIATEYVGASSIDPKGWTFTGTLGNLALLARPYARREMHFGHVMCAASITSMVRARLWREICTARRAGFPPVYCDTDSLFVDAGYVPQIVGVGLGDWERKFVATETHIVAPKLYAFRVADSNHWEHRSAGANLTARQIRAIARGKEVKWTSPVPLWRPGFSSPIFKEILY